MKAFQDDKGNISSTRIKTFIAAMIAFVIALSDTFMGSIKLGDAMPYVIILLSYSAGEKSFQSYLEHKKEVVKK